MGAKGRELLVLQSRVLYVVELYNGSRIHHSLGKDAPFHRAIERVGSITSGPFSAAFTTNIAGFDLRHTG